jgi:AcrR family transcriptional regulator
MHTGPKDPYTAAVPKLWTATIEAHRRKVHDAILHTATALVAQHGLRAVTMSQIAEDAGIGRATLYKYFPDVEAILVAWHGRKIDSHLEYLVEVQSRAVEPGARLDAVLEAYAVILHESRGHHDAELAAFLHRDDQVAQAQRLLRDLVEDALTSCAEINDIRTDIAPRELTTYCLQALGAASSLPNKPAVQRLVTITLDGLRSGR